MLFVCITVGLVFLASKFRDNVVHSVKSICQTIIPYKSSNSDRNNNNYEIHVKKELIPLDKIILADSPEQCDYAVQRIRCDLSDNVLGFDCEWVNEGPVCLLQLATYNGVCALFRLGKIGYVPLQLKELLANDCILKVGVGPYEDGRKLNNDYGCTVVGTVDLRTLANRLEVPNRKSLSALCLQYLGIEMEKIFEVRCGDWNADSLTDEQIEYAASDAISSILIFHQIQKEAEKKRSTWRKVVIFIKKTWAKKTYCDLPEAVVDIKYRGPPSSPNDKLKLHLNNEIIRGRISPSKISDISQKCSSVPTRKEPLYHNCYLQAPDGETLCTCDRKKAEWYINKNLGTKVDENPLTVRLNFEPSGRALGEVGQYYTQVKHNQCVVCGASDKFIKKNVIPREYRKYFPLVMKAHQSHDVLLLCPVCHEVSNKNDLDMRRQLAIMCDAPLTRSLSHTRSDQYQRRRQLMSAVKALKVSNSSIPPQRKKELESRVLEYTDHSDMGCNLPQLVQDQLAYEPVTSTSHRQTRPSHGLKVVQYFTNCEGGLVTLERMWREHFLISMKPRFLPNLWSVRHNQERLIIRQIQNRIEPEDAKVAGLSR